jgi:spore maturation protein CgeB
MGAEVRILLAIARYDYGNPDNGSSYEYNSWFGPLLELGHQVETFDTFGPAWVGDSEATGAALLARASAFEPDLVLMMLIEKDVPMEVVDRLRRSTTVVNWFSDDTWRFRSFSRHVAPHFSWVVTTSRQAEQAYRSMPEVKAYFSPWGYDPHLFHPVDLEPTFDVGFVGQRYGQRGAIIERLMAEGVSAVVRGVGWPGGRLAPDELANQFASTKINLNFLESSAGPFQRLGIRVRGSWRADNLISRFVPPPTQLKARPFEITACGAFLLTNVAPELPEFFQLDEEIAVFDKRRPLSERIAHYLSHEDERRRIAAAGFERSAAYSWPRLLAALLDAAG